MKPDALLSQGEAAGAAGGSFAMQLPRTPVRGLFREYMGNNFTQAEMAMIAQLDVRLHNLVGLVNDITPVLVIETHRSPARQALLLKQGKTKVRFGKHNALPSLAVDMIPEAAISDGRIQWNSRNEFAHFAGLVRGIAHAMGVPLRWGGDWDRDWDLDDNKFDDLVHFEIDEPLPQAGVSA